MASSCHAPNDEHSDEHDSSTPTPYSSLPRDNRTYAEKAYWDERFTHESSYEWLTGFDGLRAQLIPHLRTNDRILVLGCGNSELSADLYRAGYERITNIDFSSTVIQRQAAKNADKPRMAWLCMDMLAMSFPPRSFDVALDKCTMDALTTREGSPWHPDRAVRASADILLSSVSKLLPVGGRYIQVSFAQPHFRLRYLQRGAHRWTVSTERVGDGVGSVFVYTCTKGDDDDDARYDDLGWSDEEEGGDGSGGSQQLLSSDEEDVLNSIELSDHD